MTRLLLFFILFWQTATFANDECANAIQLTPGTNCVNTSGTFSGATLSGAVPACAPNASQDVWYRFTATEQTMAINVARTTSGVSLYLAMEIYEDSCTGNRFKCIASNLDVSSYFNSDFVVGRTYYVRLLNASSTINAYNFNICVQAMSRPVNDTCATATELTPTSNCVNTPGTFRGALFEGAVSQCASTSSQDVWYKFTATEQTMAINVARTTSGVSLYLAMEIFQESCTGSLFKCIASNLDTSSYFNSDFVVGRTYYVRVLNTSPIINTYGFNICVQAMSRPVNDTCATATELTPGSTCVNTPGTFRGALFEGAVSQCVSSSSQDVWYKFTATEQTMAINVARTTSGASLYLAMEIFQESCTGSLFKCITSNLDTSSYFNTDFVVGRTYYVRLLNTSPIINTYGFNICVQAMPRPANDTCATATELTPGSTCVNTPGTFRGALFEGAVSQCVSSSSQDVWYKFTATEQTMAINVARTTSGASLYLAMEIFQESCTGSLFKCITSNLDTSSYFNTDFVVGRTYYVRLLNTSPIINTYSFNICVQAMPRPVNDTCATATELTPANTCVNRSGTFRGALLDGAVSPCVTSSSQDVWYKFTATGQTMSVNVARTTSGVSLYLSMEIYEESCTGNRLQCLASSLDTSSYTSNNLVVGRTYYVRVLNSSAIINTYSFNICLVGPPPVTCTPSVTVNASANSVCQGTSVTFTATPTNGGTAPSYQWKVNGDDVGTNSPSYTTTTLANGNTVSCVMTSNAACASPTSATSNIITMNVSAQVVPAFTQVAPICSGGTFTLPAVSNNGIGGTWNPAINNTATTTYTFTPTTGQCVSSATMTVAVNLVNTATTLQGSTITATATGATYQWINCANNQPINAATSASYTASANGTYAVIVTQNGCSATSNCVQITNLGVDTFAKNELKLYPNPATHELFIQLEEATEITIADMTGKVILQMALKSGNTTVDVSSLASGMYFIKSVSGANAKFVKK